MGGVSRSPVCQRLFKSSALVLLLGSAVLASGACHSPIPPTASPSAEVKSDAANLARLADEYWRAHLEADPIEATLLGTHGYDDRMPDESPDARNQMRRRLQDLKARLETEVSDAALGEADRVTRALLLETIDGDLTFVDCHLEQWTIDPWGGPQVAYLDLASLQPVRTPADGRAMLARWRAMPKTLDQKTANLLRGLSVGKVAARSEVQRVAGQLDDLLAKPDAAWPLAAPASRIAPGSWPEAARVQFQTDLRGAITDGIRPAFTRYRDAIRDQILPHARGDAAVGIHNVPGGDACYAALVRVHTSLTINPTAVHQLGLDELARIRGEMQKLGPAAIGTADFGEHPAALAR